MLPYNRYMPWGGAFQILLHAQLCLIIVLELFHI